MSITSLSDYYSFIILQVQQQRVEKSNNKLPDENYVEDSEQLAGSSDDEEIVPVVIRPGHVRFLPLGQGLSAFLII